MKRNIWTISMVAALAAIVIAVGCKRTPKIDKPVDDGAKKAAYVSKGDEGTITGKVSFEGTPPVGKKIDMSQDANCAAAGGDKLTDDVVVSDGKLENVFVYLKGGPIDKSSFPIPSDPIVLDQQGCRYHPRILGIQANQVLKIVNSDQTTHNIHPSPKINQEWNESQAAGTAPKEKKFPNKELLIPVKCNQHPWMKANIGVLNHPYFAVTAKNGTYTIPHVPPGTYTLVFWHETFGEQTQQITIAAKESKTQDISFKAGAAAAPASLEIGPTLWLP